MQLDPMEVLVTEALKKQFEVIDVPYSDQAVATFGWQDKRSWPGYAEAAFSSWFLYSYKKLFKKETDGQQVLARWLADYGWSHPT